MPLSQRSTVRPAVGQMAKVLRYGENSARREGPENLGPPSQTAAVFGKRRRQQQLGPDRVPWGMWCALLLGARRPERGKAGRDLGPKFYREHTPRGDSHSSGGNQTCTGVSPPVVVDCGCA